MAPVGWVGGWVGWGLGLGWVGLGWVGGKHTYQYKLCNANIFDKQPISYRIIQ